MKECLYNPSFLLLFKLNPTKHTQTHLSRWTLSNPNLSSLQTDNKSVRKEYTVSLRLSRVRAENYITSWLLTKYKSLPLWSSEGQRITWKGLKSIWDTEEPCLWRSVKGSHPKKRDFLGIFPKGGGGLLKSENFCKFTKCFFVCQNHS